PLLAVAPEQPGVLPLAVWSGTGEIGLAVRREAAGTTVFCGLPTASPVLLRAIAREAGAWIYAETDDIISAGAGFVSLHAAQPGEKLLRLPRPMALRDAFSGEALPAAEVHRLRLDQGATRVLLYER
ncbi:MAG: hypothetical protein HUU35_17890, partial [Armatimonadetes bacterium]|nr:hypothetical protein [Armatimonadota bacterium]